MFLGKAWKWVDEGTRLNTNHKDDGLAHSAFSACLAWQCLDNATAQKVTLPFSRLLRCPLSPGCPGFQHGLVDSPSFLQKRLPKSIFPVCTSCI